MLGTPTEFGEILGEARWPPPRRRRLRGLRSRQDPRRSPGRVLGSGGGGRLAVLARAALARGGGRRGGGSGLASTLLQRLALAREVQVAVVLLGDVELLGRAVGVADRQLIGLTAGDLGLVEVRNVHCDRLGAHRDSFVGRSAIGAERRHLGHDNNSGPAQPDRGRIALELDLLAQVKDRCLVRREPMFSG